MADTEPEEGPKVVWTFPLARQFQSDRGFLQLGARLGNFISSDSGMMDGGPVRDRVQERRDASSSSTDEADYGQDDETSDIEDELDSLSDSSNDIFGSDEDSVEDLGPATVDIEEGVFIPTKVEIEPGETVVWENNDDEVHRVVSTSGEEFDSGQLEAGESFEHTFDEEGATVYIDSIAGGQNMSGAVIVGDAELEGPLPSADGADPVPFDDESSSTSGTRTMSEAAEDKEEMDIGFDN